MGYMMLFSNAAFLIWLFLLKNKKKIDRFYFTALVDTGFRLQKDGQLTATSDH